MKLTKKIDVAGPHVVAPGSETVGARYSTYRTLCGIEIGVRGWETGDLGQAGIKCGACRNVLVRDGVLVDERQRCSDPEAHDAHMQINGECPWCGAVEASAIREPSEWDFHDAAALRADIGENR